MACVYDPQYLPVLFSAADWLMFYEPGDAMGTLWRRFSMPGVVFRQLLLCFMRRSWRTTAAGRFAFSVRGIVVSQSED